MILKVIMIIIFITTIIINTAVVYIIIVQLLLYQRTSSEDFFYKDLGARTVLTTTTSARAKKSYHLKSIVQMSSAGSSESGRQYHIFDRSDLLLYHRPARRVWVILSTGKRNCGLRYDYPQVSITLSSESCMGLSSQAGKMGESTTFSRLLNVICLTLAIYDVLFLEEGKWKCTIFFL